MSEVDLATARLEAVAARERLLNSAHELQERLKPQKLASDAWEGVVDRSEDAASRLGRAAQRRPVAAGAAALAATALIARKPLTRLIRRLRGQTDS
jgi:hypothetical protein